jgi:signal transduction histidine kinase
MSDGLGGTMSEQQDKYIRIIKKNSTELMYFVSKLMELSQTEVEDKSPDYKIFDIVSTLNTVVRFNEQLHGNKDIKWNINVQEGLKNTITSDEEIVKTIIQNVIEVVLKSIDMGEISVSLSIPDEETILAKNLFGTNFLQISISSGSLLLSENDLEYMFEPYMIVDTPNRKNLLRAITLACVKNLVKTLNGAVWVESKILKNTSFNIIIPQGNN